MFNITKTSTANVMKLNIFLIEKLELDQNQKMKFIEHENKKYPIFTVLN